MTHGETTTPSRDWRLIQGVLTSSPMLRGLPPAELRALAQRCWSVCVNRGAVLAESGARLPGIYALAYGSVKLALRNGGSELRLLRVVSARETFGEGAALLGRPAPYEAAALAETRAVVIPTAAVIELIERDARLASGLVMAFAERELQLWREMQSAMLLTGAQRLGAYLEELAGAARTPGPCTVDLPFSKTVLASRLGLKKETLSRLLRQFADAGLIRMRQREIAILDPGRLRRLGSAGSERSP